MFEKKLRHTCDSNDKLLLKQVGQGNKAAFNHLYEKYWEQVYSNTYKRLRDHDQTKDIVQEIFSHLWVKKEILAIENLPAYLHVTVRNKVFKLVAKQQLSHPFLDVMETLKSVQPLPDSHLLTKEFFSAFEVLIKTLSSKKQLIFRLRFQEDMSTKCIADQLKLSRKTVQNQLSKAIEQLRVTMLYLPAILLSLFS